MKLESIIDKLLDLRGKERLCGIESLKNKAFGKHPCASEPLNSFQSTLTRLIFKTGP